MMCHVHQVTYDFDQRVGVVQMPEMNCTDAMGAVAFFTRIDPKVQRVETVAGGYLDTVYVRDTSTSWGWRSSTAYPSQRLPATSAVVVVVR